MNLAETQRIFHALATRAVGADPELASALLVATSELGAADRVAIYADMYLWRQVDALREEFPKLAAALGDEGFFALGEAYVKAHPSESPDLGQLGRRLAEFLRSNPGLGGPGLADLAELEWARSQVFFEAAIQPAGRDALAAIPAQDFGRARLSLVPHLRLLFLDSDATALWRRLEAGEPPGEARAVVTPLAIWRSGFEVFHSILPLDEAAALRSAAAGDPLERVCSAFSGREDAVPAAFQAIASWADEGWIAAVRLADC